MRQSQLFYHAHKKPAKDAETASHRFLVQAGYIDQLAAGIYSYLPLGHRVYKKIEQIIREEMDAIGGQELFLPTLQPKSIWTETKRWETIDPPLFVLRDRHKKELALGPTHEEVITDIVRRSVSSYKDLPFALYQIQNKFRNEMRATGGLLRVREFIMKDMYSFHADNDDLNAYYERALGAYKKIYARCGVEALIVAAESGSIGGDESHECMVLAESGENTVIRCTACAYAQNQEKGDTSACPVCKEPTEKVKAIEAGHIFKLRDKYSSAMRATFTAQNGEKKPIIMGCYGIGLGRLLATIVEASHDDKGIIWPETVAPFTYHLLVFDQEDVTVVKHAQCAYEVLCRKKAEVLYDDRNVAPGEKMHESDLLGIPYRLIVSSKTREKVEIKWRGNKDIRLVSLDELSAHGLLST